MAHRFNQVGDSEEQPRQKEHYRPQRPGGGVRNHEHLGNRVRAKEDVRTLATRRSPHETRHAHARLPIPVGV